MTWSSKQSGCSNKLVTVLTSKNGVGKTAQARRTCRGRYRCHDQHQVRARSFVSSKWRLRKRPDPRIAGAYVSQGHKTKPKKRSLEGSQD